MSSSYYLHTFTWDGEADSITVTGSFDNWSSSLPLSLVSPSTRPGFERSETGTATPRKASPRDGKRWSATCELEFGVKVVYKYVINGGHWVHSTSSPHESDASGNVNNHFTPPSLYIPKIPISIPLEFTSSDRNVQVLRWESDDESNGQLEVLAGTCTSPNLRFATLRTILSLLLAIPSGAFRFGRLASTAVSPTGGSSHYGVEQIQEPLEKDAAHQESDLVPSGFFVLLQPGEVPSPILKNPSTVPVPLSHHLSLTSHQMNSTDSLSSSASFSTALSTSFSVSALGSIAGEESYVCVHDAGRLWLYEPEGTPLRDADEEVRKSWFDLQWGFDPETAFSALPFTMSAALLTPYLSYAAPSTTLERTQCEEYLHGHFLECVNRWVRGRGHIEDIVEVMTDDEWEEA